MEEEYLLDGEMYSLADIKILAEEAELKLGKLAQPVRVALTGSTASPGIYEVILLLGKAITLKRLNEAVSFIEKQD